MPVRTRPRGIVSMLGGVVLAWVVVIGMAVPAGAVPAPPDNPSDDQIQAGQSHVATSAAEVGRLSGLVSKTEGDIERLKNDMELKAELANKAAVDLQVAQSDAAAAVRRRHAGAVRRRRRQARPSTTPRPRPPRSPPLVPPGLGARVDDGADGFRQRHRTTAAAGTARPGFRNPAQRDLQPREQPEPQGQPRLGRPRGPRCRQRRPGTGGPGQDRMPTAPSNRPPTRSPPVGTSSPALGRPADPAAERLPGGTVERRWFAAAAGSVQPVARAEAGRGRGGPQGRRGGGQAGCRRRGGRGRPPGRRSGRRAGSRRRAAAEQAAAEQAAAEQAAEQEAAAERASAAQEASNQAARAAQQAAAGSEPFYDSCDAARAAGRGPISQGEPGYRVGPRPERQRRRLRGHGGRRRSHREL